MQQKPVQQYQYDAEILTITKEDEAYFAEHFRPELAPDKMHWLNYHSMADREQITKLCERLDIDKLTVEDLFKGTKRPRLEEYPTYIFFSILSALPEDRANFTLKEERVSFIMGQNFLISFQERSSDHFPDVRERLEMRKGKLRFKGPDYLLFRMLEAIIDNYMEVVDEISGKIEDMEKLIVRYVKSDTLRQIEWQKRKLMELRKIVQPMRELVTQLERVENNLFAAENNHYYDDLKDSCLSVIDEIDVQKQILEGITNLYYAVQGQKMNEIMKVLTVFTVIFIPLTFIVGVYGMNFDFMPELKWKYGYFFVLGIMALIAGGLIFVFYKRGWLRRKS